MDFAFTPPAIPSVPITGVSERFPVHRIYCVGRNYADHVKEMGGDPKSEAPVFFSKPADAVVTDNHDVSYPQATADLHHEVELVVALKAGGEKLSLEDALACVYGYGVGIDFTCRDLQAEAKKHGRPWDAAKGFDQSAPISALALASDIGHPQSAAISLHVNGELRQQGNLSQLIWSVPEIIQTLSTLYRLQAGDLIFTGTPAGVAAVQKGDRIVARVQDVAELQFQLY